MTKETALNKNRMLIFVMLAAGGALLAYALFHSSSQSTIPGWEPVNASLEKALATTNPSSSQKTNKVTSQTEPSVSSAAASPTAQSSPLTGSNHLASGSPNDNSSTQAPSATKDPALTSKDPASTSTEAASASTSTSSAASNLLDLNQATQAQLETLPGIGPSKALAIITYREQHNGYQSVEQLLKVKGIGPKMLARISPLVQASPTK